MGKIVTATELAEFMGISVRALRRLDDEGRLVAFRRPSGRRYYTSAHIISALEIMRGAQEGTVRVSFCKNGLSSLYGKIALPYKRLAEIGVTPENPKLCVSYLGDKIILSPPPQKK